MASEPNAHDKFIAALTRSDEPEIRAWAKALQKGDPPEEPPPAKVPMKGKRAKANLRKPPRRKARHG